MSELDLDAVLARHGHDEHMGMCSLCMFEWPCDAMRLVAEVRRLRARMLAQDAVLDELRAEVRRLRGLMRACLALNNARTGSDLIAAETAWRAALAPFLEADRG